MLLSSLIEEMGNHKVWVIPYFFIHGDENINAIPTVKQDIYFRNGRRPSIIPENSMSSVIKW